MQGFVSDGIGNVCWRWFRTLNLWFEQVEKVHEPIDLVNPIVEFWVFHRFSIFISRLFWTSGEAIGAVSGTGEWMRVK